MMNEVTNWNAVKFENGDSLNAEDKCDIFTVGFYSLTLAKVLVNKILAIGKLKVVYCLIIPFHWIVNS